MIKEYTITTNGMSKGNVITAPFKVQVNVMDYKNVLKVCVCTVNGTNVVCDNDDITGVLTYGLPALTSSKEADLTATIEVLLEEVYPGAWS
jgi:hypothetical protein